MLKKVYRVRKQKEYDLIYAKHKTFRSASFSLLIHKCTAIADTRLPQFGIVASKKVGGAVERNRAKRILRVILHNQLSTLQNNFKAIVIASPDILKKNYAELCIEVDSILREAGLKKQN